MVRATPAPSRDNALLGMIVDRTSFDEGDREGDLSVVDNPPDERKLKRRSDGKVRRKLRWKPQAFRSSKQRLPPSNPARSSTADSVVTERSAKTNKSTMSFHTFNSTETPVQSNQKNKKPLPSTRPNYRDTFEGVATIESEGQYIHAKTSNSSNNKKLTNDALERKDNHEIQQSIPETQKLGFDFQSIDGESFSSSMNADEHDAAGGQSHIFDPFGDAMQSRSFTSQNSNSNGSKNKRRPPRGAKSRRIIQQHDRQQPSPGESPLTRKQPMDVLRIASPGDAPLLLVPSEISEEDADDSFVIDEEVFADDLQVSFLNNTDDSSHTGLGISPIKIPTTISPFATPIKPSPSGRPPISTPRKQQQRSPQYHTSSPSPIKPPTPLQTPVQATVGRIDLSESSLSLNGMLANSGILQGSPMPEMPMTTFGASSPPYHNREDAFATPKKKKSSFRLRRGSSQFVADDDAISTSSNGNKNSVLVVSNEDSAQPGNVVRHGSRLVATNSLSSRSMSSRNQTGPVDVDEGAFVEAERHLKAIHDMAAEHLNHGEYEEALDVFEEILRGQQERYGSDHYRIGTALHNIGIVHLKSGNFDKAVDVCQEAVKVRKATLVPNHPDVAVSLAQLGVALLEGKQHETALVAFREALQIRRNVLGSKHPKVGKILNNVGCALYELNELNGAQLAFEEALAIQRETLRCSPVPGDDSETRSNSNSALLSIAATLCNLGSIQVRYSKFEDASVALEEALLIQQSVLGDEHPTVLSTIDSIDHVDKSLDKSTDRTAATDFFSQWTGTSETASISEDSNPGADSPSAGKLLSLMSTITWSRSKRFYQRIEEMIPRDAVACGGVRDVVDDVASAGASEGSSTWSFREARQIGFEI